MVPPPPPVRSDVEIHPVEHEGQPLFVLQDVEGLAPDPIGVAPGGLAVAGLFDGKRTAQDIQDLLFKETGQRVPVEQISALAAELEKAGMLETPDVARRRRELAEEFLRSPVRKPVHQGLGYPGDRLELAAYVGKFFEKGPGAQPGPAAGAPLRGLVAPHIDLARGGHAYAWAYKALAESPPPDVIVALGVAHVSPPSPWTFTRKEYETPNGPMKVDAELYDALARRLWYDPAADEWVHRREHSLEFQALWLRYIWKDRTPPWVPILCSSFERWAADRAPSTVETVDKALQGMAAALKGRRVLILAGVDLAHVGPHFGDEHELGPELERKVEHEDRRSLEHALKGDADALYLSVVADGHWRKWCGLSAAYTALRLLGGSQGKLLAYGQAADQRGGLVSFASAAFA